MGVIQLRSWEISGTVGTFLYSMTIADPRFIAIKDGSSTERLQCLPCRAPEVWQGYSCRHASDVWSLAVTVRSYYHLSRRTLI
jgi:hypothetical protein